MGEPMRFRRGLVTLLAMVTVAGVGCSASTITGEPRPGMASVDVASLKTGAYKPEPSAYDPMIDTPGELRAVEARRMLNYLVVPSDIDSDITELSGTELFTTPEMPFILETLPEKYRPVTVDNNLLIGVYVVRINKDLRSRKKLIISVLRFPTEAASRKAVEQFDQITNADPGRHTILVDGHADARTSSADDITAVSFMPHGSFVILVNAGVPQPNQTALAGVIGTTIDQQVARLAQFQPTPLDDILDLPMDQDGIMRRALPKAPGGGDPFYNDDDFGPVQPAGQLHFERNPVEMKRALEESGVDLIGRRGGIVYRTRDLSAAFHLQSVLVKAGRNDEELEPPPGLPDARCVRIEFVDQVRHFDELCAVVRGRYVGVVVAKSRFNGRSDPALYNRAAAQYAILARSE